MSQLLLPCGTSWKLELRIRHSFSEWGIESVPLCAMRPSHVSWLIVFAGLIIEHSIVGATLSTTIYKSILYALDH